MSLDGGLGAVVSKNNILLSDSINQGGFTRYVDMGMVVIGGLYVIVTAKMILWNFYSPKMVSLLHNSGDWIGKKWL